MLVTATVRSSLFLKEHFEDLSRRNIISKRMASKEFEGNFLARMWRNGGRMALICIPAFVGFHYLWYKMQYMEEFVPKEQQKPVMRVGPVLLDREKGVTVIKPQDWSKSYELQQELEKDE